MEEREERIKKLAEILEYFTGGPKGTNKQRQASLSEIDLELEELYRPTKL